MTSKYEQAVKDLQGRQCPACKGSGMYDDTEPGSISYHEWVRGECKDTDIKKTQGPYEVHVTVSKLKKRAVTTAYLFSGNVLVGTGCAICSPTDEFDLDLGVTIAVGRSIKDAKLKSKPEGIKYETRQY